MFIKYVKTKYNKGDEKSIQEEIENSYKKKEKQPLMDVNNSIKNAPTAPTHTKIGRSFIKVLANPETTKPVANFRRGSKLFTNAGKVFEGQTFIGKNQREKLINKETQTDNQSNKNKIESKIADHTIASSLVKKLAPTNKKDFLTDNEEEKNKITITGGQPVKNVKESEFNRVRFDQ